MALTISQVRSAAACDKDYKLADSLGLYLFVTKNGARSWRMKYRFAGKEKRITFGLFPEVTLAEARDRRDEARRLLRDNRDPVTEDRRRRASAAAAAAATFESVARDWHEAERPRWSADYGALIMRALERDVFGEIGRMPIADVDRAALLRLLRKVEARGSLETAKRIRQYISAVFVRAEAEGLVAADPSAKLASALKKVAKKGKQPALTELRQLHALQAAIDASSAGPATKLASRLLALTVVRPGVLRSGSWSEIEGVDWARHDAPTPAALWRIPAARMKLEIADKGEAAYDHEVPLTAESVAVLRALHRLTGRGRYLFPSIRSAARPMSENAIGYMYNREGYAGRHVPHGWRSAFSTVMNERAAGQGREGDRLIIDLMLAHVPQGMSGSEFAYNRARYSTRRRELAEAWAAMISEGLAPPNDLVDGQER